MTTFGDLFRRFTTPQRKRRGHRLPLRLEALEDRCVPTLLGQQLFPSDNPWNQRVAAAPVAANSQAIMDSIVATFGNNRLHPDFGENYANGSDLYGIPYNVVRGNSTPRVSVVIDAYPEESDIVAAPIPPTVVLEGDYQNGPRPGGADARGDSHLLLYDVDNNVAYEFYRMSRPSENGDGKWHADQQTVWDMKTNTFRTLGDTSADAAGLSILAGLVRPDEALPVSQGGQGAINHAIRFTLRNSVILDQFLYPASHTANPGNNNVAVQPPMGARFRLKASVDISQMNPQAKVVAQAMKDYGMIVADNGSNFFFSGASDAIDANNNRVLTWDDDDIQSSTRGLKSLRFSDFEVVDLTPIVTDLSVHAGNAGTSVTVVGQNFAGAAGRVKVYFGGAEATSVTVVDDGHITAVAPAGTGTVDVRVQSGQTIAPNPDNIRNTIFGYGLSAISTNGRFAYGGSTQAPAFLSAGGVTFTEGQPGTFTVRASGTPLPSLGVSGALPAGVTFTPHQDGTATLGGTAVLGSDGVYALTITASNGVGQPATQTFTLTVRERVAVPVVAVGTAAGTNAAVAAYSSAGVRTVLRPYGTSFKGGIRVATGDVNADGVSDVIVAPGPGVAATVKVYSGAGYALLRSFNPFGAGFKGGAFVAAGDVFGLGAAQVVVGAGQGRGPTVNIYDLRSGVLLRKSVTAFESGFTWGVTVGAADGTMVAGRASHGGAVRVYDGPNLDRVRVVKPFGDAFMGGVTVAAGGGRVVAGRNAGGADVVIYRLSDLAVEKALQTRTTGPAAGYSGGTRVAWTRTSTGDWELLTGTGPGWSALAQFWVPGTWQRRAQRAEFGGWVGGVFVA